MIIEGSFCLFGGAAVLIRLHIAFILSCVLLALFNTEQKSSRETEMMPNEDSFSQ